MLDLKSLPVNNPTSPTSDGNITSKTGGLIFSRVKLVDEKSLEPIISNPSNHDKIIHTGLTVYNLNETSPFKSGLYCWDGNKWGTLTLRVQIH